MIKKLIITCAMCAFFFCGMTVAKKIDNMQNVEFELIDIVSAGKILVHSKDLEFIVVIFPNGATAVFEDTGNGNKFRLVVGAYSLVVTKDLQRMITAKIGTLV